LTTRIYNTCVSLAPVESLESTECFVVGPAVWHWRPSSDEVMSIACARYAVHNSAVGFTLKKVLSQTAW